MFMRKCVRDEQDKRVFTLRCSVRRSRRSEGERQPSVWTEESKGEQSRGCAALPRGGVRSAVKCRVAYECTNNLCVASPRSIHRNAEQQLRLCGLGSDWAIRAVQSTPTGVADSRVNTSQLNDRSRSLRCLSPAKTQRRRSGHWQRWRWGRRLRCVRACATGRGGRGVRGQWAQIAPHRELRGEKGRAAAAVAAAVALPQKGFY